MSTNVFVRVFDAIRGNKKCTFSQHEYITLLPIARKSNLSEGDRRTYATELLDVYKGFGITYLRGLIKNSFKSPITQLPMIELAVNLPLLKRFVNSISRVYYTNPHRRFFKDDKEIVAKLPSEFSDKEKYLENDKLFNQLNDLYNDRVVVALKKAERYTNLLQTTVYKINTKEDGSIDIVFIPNDGIQICEDREDVTSAEKIIFIRHQFDGVTKQEIELTKEIWGVEQRIIPEFDKEGSMSEEVKPNEAGNEAKKLFGFKKIGYAFAPFVVFRNDSPDITFWDIKESDTVDYIYAINMSLTELRYLTRYTSFGQKYIVNVKPPKDGILDPIGIIEFIKKDSGVPGGGNITRDWEIGEFPNKGRIKEVIESIIFNLKMLYELYDINLDSLISTNSVRSADSKDKDSDNLFDVINAQREIWNLNEQSLFKVIQSVHNRDNKDKIPKGIELLVDYDELKSKNKTNQDWVLEINNNVSSLLDWISDLNPDLDRDELMRIFKDNKSTNEMNVDPEEVDDIMKEKNNIDTQKDKPKEKKDA